MKRHLKIFWTLTLLAASGCQSPSRPVNGVQVRIPVDDGFNHYSFQTVELKTIHNLDTMSGDVVQFKTKGSMQVGDDSKAYLNEGFTPNARFTLEDGVFVPTDFWSTALATGYYHFERIKEFFDRFGDNSVLTFPRMVLYDLMLFDVTARGVKLPKVNNAVYIATFDVFAVTPYDAGKVPVAFNGGILAHEYTHSIFNRHVDKFAKKFPQDWTALATNEDSEESQNLIANQFFLSSLDEGIADYFASEYTGNPDFHSASYPTQISRDRNVRQLKPFNEKDGRDDLEKILSDKKLRTHLDAHAYGGRFASFLWQMNEKWKDKSTHSIVWNAIDIYLEHLVEKATEQKVGFGYFAVALLKAKKNYADMVQKSSYAGDDDCKFARLIFGSYLEQGSMAEVCPSRTPPSTEPVVIPALTDDDNPEIDTIGGDKDPFVKPYSVLKKVGA